MRRTVMTAAVASAATILLVPQVAMASDWSVDRTLWTVQRSGSDFGRTFSEAVDGNSVGWSEARFLNGISQAFNATGNTHWADQLVDHADRLIGNASDPDGDGYLGWPTGEKSFSHIPNARGEDQAFTVEGAATGATQLVVNGGFEDGLTGWDQVGSPSGVELASDADDVYDGAGAVIVHSDSAGTENMLVQELATEPGRKYVVEAAVQNEPAGDNGVTHGFFEVVDADSGESVREMFAVPAGYEQYARTFTAPESGAVELRLFLYDYSQPGWRAAFDDVSVTELSSHDEDVVQTEAWGWDRGSTPLELAHRTNDPTATANKNWAYRLIRDGGATPSVSATFSSNYAPETYYLANVVTSVDENATGRMELIDDTTGETLFSRDFTSDDNRCHGNCGFTTPPAGHDLRWEMTVPKGPDGASMSAREMDIGVARELQVSNGNAMIPVLEFANAVYANPELSEYRDKADEYVRFIADNLVGKWDSRWRQLTGTDGANNGTGVYVGGRFGRNSEGRSGPYNMMLTFAGMLYLLHDATAHVPEYAEQRSLYLSRANDLNWAFKANVQTEHPLNDDAYFWTYSDPRGSWDAGNRLWDTNYYLREDTSHSGHTMRGVLMAYQRGQVWDADDMRGFATTFLEVMWNGSLDNPQIAAHTDGSGMSAANNRLMQLWATFAEFDPTFYDLASAKFELASGSNLDDDVQLVRFARNKVINPRFDWANLDDQNIPMYWEPIEGTRHRHLYRPDGQASAEHTLRLLGVDNGMEQRLSEYEPGAEYRVWLRGSAARTATVEVYDYTTSESLGQAELTGIGEVSSVIEAMPAEPGHDVRVRVSSHGSATIDEVRALPEPYQNEIATGDFESVHQGNNTGLPRYWIRGEDTAAANVAIDTDEYRTGLSSLRLDTADDGVAQELTYGSAVSGAGWKGYHQLGEQYTLQAYGKANATGAGTVTVTDENTGEVLAQLSFDSEEWEKKTATFTTPDAYDHVLTVVITHDDPAASDGTLWIDDLAAFTS